MASIGAEFAHELKSEAKPWTSERFLDDPQEFHFAIIGDLTGGERKGIYAKAVTALNLLRPEFVMSVGDLVAGGGVSRSDLEKQWASFRARTAKLEMPDDIMEMLDHLDDEQPESAPTTNVTVQSGGINVQQANTVTK